MLGGWRLELYVMILFEFYLKNADPSASGYYPVTYGNSQIFSSLLNNLLNNTRSQISITTWKTDVKMWHWRSAYTQYLLIFKCLVTSQELFIKYFIRFCWTC